MLAVCLVISGVYVYTSLNTQVFSDVQNMNMPKISAHRGDSVSTPENTIPAFESAIKNMADYAEIEKLDAGSWFSAKYKGTKIPTLDQVMDTCKGRIKLNIELKPSDSNENFEEEVVQTIKKHDFERQCVITSLDYNCVKKVNKLDPKLKCGVILTVALGDLDEMKGVDFFSLDSSFITQKLVNKLHSEGIEVHAWTVDNEDSQARMSELGVDNIITNDPVKAREIIYSKGNNTKMDKILDLIFTN